LLPSNGGRLDRGWFTIQTIRNKKIINLSQNLIWITIKLHYYHYRQHLSILIRYCSLDWYQCNHSFNMIKTEQNTAEIPSFTLYPISTQDLKTCYESASYKIICTLAGPYYDKKLTQLQPYFNIAIANSSHPLSTAIFTPEELNKFERKLQEVLNVMVVRGRY